MKFVTAALAVLLPCFAANVGQPDRAKMIGNPSSPVKIDLYSDFQCPACKMFHDGLLKVIVRDYVIPGKAYVVQHEFPLPQHAYSREAANIATAAATIGKYHEVADALFAHQQAWETSGKVWDFVAPVLKPDEQKKVQALAKDPSIAAQVQADADAARKLNVPQTPTIYVSRGAKTYPFPGPDLGNYPLLKSLIDGLLK